MRIFTYCPPSGLPDIIFEDDYYLAIHKPSGLLSNPGRAENTFDCALTRLQSMRPEIHLIHRLDCDTSGVLIFAKQKKAEGALKKQFQLRETEKTYHAKVLGIPVKNRGIISAPLAPNPDERPLQMVSPEGKEAITHYQLEASNPSTNQSLITLHPKTGRTHQLRVHLTHIGHPILGDSFYAPQAALEASNRLCLHASQLAFEHPFTQKWITIETPFNFDAT